MNLTDKGVFLTGGARGIGRGMMEGLLSKGAKVLFCDVNAETGKQTETELQSRFGASNVTFVQCDVTNDASLKATFEAAVSKFGAVDICVNNAGIMDERVWEKMIQINATAQIRGSQLALEHMRRDKGGRGGLIINTASIAGLMPCYWFPVYTATKHAIIGFTTSCNISCEHLDLGVRVRCLCPAPVNTELIVVDDDQVYDVEDFRQRLNTFKLETEEVVEAFMKLVQDENSDDVIYWVWKGQGGVYGLHTAILSVDWGEVGGGSTEFNSLSPRAPRHMLFAWATGDSRMQCRVLRATIVYRDA